MMWGMTVRGEVARVMMMTNSRYGTDRGGDGQTEGGHEDEGDRDDLHDEKLHERDDTPVWCRRRWR